MKKFWTKYEHTTVEQWLVKAIHENCDFSLSVKQIPSASFVKNFKKKYEIEFLRNESMDQLNGVERNTESQYTLQNAISSGHSSIYSQNLSRQISVASHGSSFKEQLDHVTLLKQFDANTQKQLNHDKDQPTTNSTNVQNSQVTLNTDGEQQRGSGIPGDINVFNQNDSHINMVDNSAVPKIDRVEYVVDIG